MSPPRDGRGRHGTIHRVAAIVASVLVLAVATVTSGAVSAATGVVTEYSSGISSSSLPQAIVVGPDGKLWFTEYGGDRIGRLDPATGNTVEYAVGDRPYGIVAGPDGNLWFTEVGTDKIGKITTSGVVTYYPLAVGSFPQGIAVGPDGSVWFTETTGNKIGRITMAGAITQYSAGITAGSQPIGIAAGPDGNMWFTELNGNRIGRITMAGVVTEYSAGITAGALPFSIVAGPDGNMWFTELYANKIGRITTAGAVTEYALSGSYGPYGITVGPDGALWFAERGNSRIGRITTAGSITSFSSGISSGAAPWGVAAGLDGAMWFTEYGLSQVGRLTVDLPECADGTGYTASTGCVVPADITSMDVLVVGGGGGGGPRDGSLRYGSGGGGGGEVTVCTDVPVTPGATVTLTVGAGGTGGWYDAASGTLVDAAAGATTSVVDKSATALCAALGGRGGVTGTDEALVASFSGYGGASGNANAGGTSWFDESPTPIGGGGGGGAAEVGADADNDVSLSGGAGGAGQQVSALTSPGAFSNLDAYFGGGGGGGAYGSGFGIRGSGGLGGGGNGGDDSESGTPPTNGAPGTGGGGGGDATDSGSSSRAGSGGSGYLELRFGDGGGDPSPTATTTSTQVSATSISVGGTVSDTATVTYAGSPSSTPTGTVQFSYCYSASSAPSSCTTGTDIGTAIALSATAPHMATLSNWSPADGAGYYLLHAEYSGDANFAGSADDGTNEAFVVTKVQSSVSYTGDTGVLPATTTSLSLSSTVSPSPACSTPAVAYLVNGVQTTSPFTVTEAGVFEIEARYAGNADCEASSAFAVVVIGSAGDATTGGGWYKVDASVSGASRVNFGHTVQKLSVTDKKTGNTTTTYRGQMLWSNSPAWRVKGTIYSSTVTKNGSYVSGDTSPAYTTFTCPPTPVIGQSGSNAKCGSFRGTGILQAWDAAMATWVTATQFGVNGAVTFVARVYDGGSVSSCTTVSGKKTCTVTDVADWFGLTIAGVSTSDHIPVGAPVVVQMQKNKTGSIVVR